MWEKGECGDSGGATAAPSDQEQNSCLVGKTADACSKTSKFLESRLAREPVAWNNVRLPLIVGRIY
jgi:hypothetical protein